MNIGALAELSGVATSAIRYYEKAGLLPRVERKANGYRVYNAASVEHLRLIGFAQRLGFSLDAIRAVLALEGDALHDAMAASIDTRLDEIDAMMHVLQLQRAALLDAKHRACAGKP
jgi:MerR family copper efflux transcriptional regulator